MKKENYVPSNSNSNVTSVASHSCASGISIEQGNKLIAEFMGMKSTGGRYRKQLSPWITTDAKYLEYANCWNSLMPVVEKIEDCGDNLGQLVGVCINFNFCSITPIGGDAIVVNSYSKIKATWQAVVEFIEWYNSIK